MTNLPITSSAPPIAATSAAPANANDTSDAQNTQPFGEVLARQIKDPTAKDAKADEKRTSDTLTLLDSDTDSAQDTAANSTPVDSTGTLPMDMLAALMPQAMISGGKTTDSSTATEQNTRAITSPKTDITLGISKEATSKTSPEIKLDSPATRPAFTAALAESAKNGTASTALNATPVETAPIPSTTAALAALQNSVASIAAPIIQPAQITINTPVNQDKWSDEFSQKITWLASSNQDQTAELHLNPPQLGPLDVVIKVSGDQATALFTSPHAAVRDVIEQALPKLRDMLADNGIMLGNATVSDQTPRDQGQSANPRSSGSTSNDIPDTLVSGNSAARVSQISRHNGIVDTFA